jgi:hypothetical protein
MKNTRDGRGWVGRMSCSAAPVQIEGLVDGRPFYFRARYQRWSFSVAERSDKNAVDVSCGFTPGFHIDTRYGAEGELFAASWMPTEEAWDLVAQSIEKFREMNGRA